MWLLQKIVICYVGLGCAVLEPDDGKNVYATEPECHADAKRRVEGFNEHVVVTVGMAVAGEASWICVSAAGQGVITEAP